MNVAVILAGGKSRRMGTDKLMLTLHGETILQSAVRRFSSVFDKVYLSVSSPDKYHDIGAPRLEDIFPGCGPLSGLHAALRREEAVFLAAADLPFARPEAALQIIRLCGDSPACVIKHSDGKLEPLFGYYRRAALMPCQRALEAGRYSMAEIIGEIGARFVTARDLGDVWDDELLVNVNRPEDYEKIQNRILE